MICREELLAYVKETYAIEPDHPWKQYPQNAVLRHSKNRKWFGLIMEVSSKKLGMKDDTMLEILDVKCDPLMMGSLMGQPGVFPAYHMSKAHWITIVLSSEFPKESVLELLDLSYTLTQS